MEHRFNWIKKETVIVFSIGFLICFLLELFAPFDWWNSWRQYLVNYSSILLGIIYLLRSLEKEKLKNLLLFVFAFSISCGYLNYILYPSSDLVTLKQILFHITTHNLILPFGVAVLLVIQEG